MRRKSEAVLPFTWNNDRLPKSVRDWREKYKRISQILDKHPEVLDWIHEELKKLSRGSGKAREGDFTSETILRALIVHAVEGSSLRETVRQIAESEFLQDFLRTRKRAGGWCDQRVDVERPRFHRRKWVSQHNDRHRRLRAGV